MKFKIPVWSLALLGALSMPLSAEELKVGEMATMINPMMWADVPDPDVIRVGDDFYMVTTTMHLMPGCPVMHSKDLVNWETVSYMFDKLTDTPNYDLDGGTVYGKGQWATSLRYHDGRFVALFSPNDEPYKSYIYEAEKAEGPWKLICRAPHFHDSSLFFDDDGKAYVFYGSGDIKLRELNPDLSGVKEGGVNMTVIRTNDDTAGLHEGSRVIKHNGKYYVMIINWPKNGPRRQLCYRADKITGPYEYKVVLEDNFAGFPYVAQGTLVDDSDGNWWGVIFQDRNAVGRVLTLSPCKWENGWPVIGNNGKVPLHVDYKCRSAKPTELVKSDDFSGKTLGYHWEWNHNPDDSAWSLAERPGYLRLKTSRMAANIYEAVNTISQRMEGPSCDGTVCLDLSKMKDGDVAGFGAFNGHSTLLSISKEGGRKTLRKHNTVVNFKEGSKVIDNVEDEAEETVALKSNKVYLRICADFRLGRDTATCHYSTDGKSWKQLGKEYKMRYDYRRLFMGQRFAVYNYATKTPGGYIDVDSFEYNRAPDEAARTACR